MADTTGKSAIVKVLALQGKGKKIYHSGEKVIPENFPEGNFDALIKSGHIIEAKIQASEPTIDTEKEKAKEAHALAVKEAREALNGLIADYEVEVTEEMTTDQINEAIEQKKSILAHAEKVVAARAILTKYEIEFSEEASLEALNDLIADYEAQNIKSFVNGKGQTVIVKSIDDISKNELIFELEKSNVVFDKNSKKPVLFTQWIELK